jgi:hypothetical protein
MKPGAKPDDLKVGSILSGKGDTQHKDNEDPSCYAILRTVVAIEKKGTDRLLITTKSDNVSFLDAFDSILLNQTDMMQHVKPDPNSNSTGNTSYTSSLGMGFNFPIDYNEGFEPISGVTITPSFHMSPAVKFFVDKKSGSAPTVRVTVSSDLKAGVTLKGRMSANAQKTMKKQLYTHVFAGGIIWISFVPVYYQPCLTIDGEIDLSAKVLV